MKTNKQFLLLGLLPVLFFLQMGCTHIALETYPEEGPVNIAFNWSNLLTGDSIPAAMKLYFYGKDAVITRDCKDSVYSGKLPNGSYQVIAYNTDVTNVTYNYLDTYTGAEALAQTQNSGTKATTCLSQPSHSYGCGLGSITVLGDSVVNETMSPLSFVKKIHVKYTVTGEKQAIASCDGSLSGLALSVNIVTGRPVGNTGAVSFTSSPTGDGYESTVTIMGVSDSTTTKNLSTVLNFTGGGSQTIDVDATSALVGVNEAVIPINVNLTIAVTGTVEAGFGATLTGWTVDTENVTVE
jgi:hypothetical protein